MDLDAAATVEVTSEDADFPIEASLSAHQAHGWRAAEPGSQLVFDERQRLKRVSLVFEEEESTRPQEFVLRWSTEKIGSFRELGRQRWNFSPPTTTREIEEYSVELSMLLCSN